MSFRLLHLLTDLSPSLPPSLALSLSLLIDFSTKLCPQSGTAGGFLSLVFFLAGLDFFLIFLTLKFKFLTESEASIGETVQQTHLQ